MSRQRIYFFRIIFFYGRGEYREERIQEYRSVHHPNFHDLHRESVESDYGISHGFLCHEREEDGINFKKYDIQKESESVGKRCPDKRLDIAHIPGKSYRLIATDVPPGEGGHEDIACESREHDEGEFLCMRNPSKNCYKKEDHPKCQELSSGIRDERELSPECRLEVAHERAIHESCEGKSSCDRYPDQGFGAIVPGEKECQEKRASYDDDTRESTQREDIS
jgi:hypothetical protein